MRVLWERFKHLLGYIAVARPCFVFGLIIFYLPLTAFESVPGNSMLGNLFVEYTFGWAFWFGFALFGAVWAVMLTACLTLDAERDRPNSWIYDPGKNNRWVSIPIGTRTFFFFTLLLGGPGFFVMILNADAYILGALGLVLGAMLAFILMDLMIYLAYYSDLNFRVLPWPPFFGLIPPWEGLKFVSGFFSLLARITGAPPYFFRPDGRTLRDEQLFGVFSLAAVSFIYWVVYLSLPSIGIERLPPAGFIYALLLPLIWFISHLWFRFRQYRITLIVCILYGVFIYWLGGKLETTTPINGPAHTYDVFVAGSAKSLPPAEVLRPLITTGRPDEKQPNLIIVAASGGGILATGWTTKVLSELHSSYEHFRRELRLLSTVSGGSVGAAFYVSAHEKGKEPLSCEVLRDVVKNSMKSSLAITSYGFAFPDFRRAIFPIGTDEEFDRGRLLENDWRNNASKQHPKYPVLFSEWREAIQDGSKPAVIFNATVMETGERIAITPLSTLRSDWLGWKIDGKAPHPERHNYARTLSEFLGGEGKYSVDLWTAARLSATFSYVSPAARASFATHTGKEAIARRIPNNSDEKTGRLHLIDGGYHDNYGVASALDWLAAALNNNMNSKDPPFARIALIEIKAKLDIPEEKASSQWGAAWLGPLYGLVNSWGFTQTAANDTAVNRMIQRFKQFMKSSGYEVPFESFVFVPEEKGPLSWHLSKKQQRFVHDSWVEGKNPEVLQAFLRFVNGLDPKDTSKSQKPFRTCPKT